jgi:tetratricopeptide (TPR) repeat protein
MADLPRIDELKRRVRQDPASISFAALAEEYRRAGQFQEAIDACREGLRHHPGYVSARVTLGRALLEAGEFEEARGELEYVLGAAPENLAATRALEEIRRRCDAPSPAPSVQPGPARAAVLEIQRIPVSQTAPVDTEIAAVVIDSSQAADEHLHATAKEPALSGLEEFLEAILRARRETEPSHEHRR